MVEEIKVTQAPSPAATSFFCWVRHTASPCPTP